MKKSFSKRKVPWSSHPLELNHYVDNRFKILFWTSTHRHCSAHLVEMSLCKTLSQSSGKHVSISEPSIKSNVRSYWWVSAVHYQMTPSSLASLQTFLECLLIYLEENSLILTGNYQDYIIFRYLGLNPFESSPKQCRIKT